MYEMKDRLNRLLQAAGLPPLLPETAAVFEKYLQLIQHWNARINLTAVRDEDEILSRHFVESIACALALPTEIKTLLDFGSGAGFPGIPIAICRPGIAVTLAESQGKKAAFLHEAIRTLQLSVTVHSARAETLKERFGCVTLRAVDHMEEAVGVSARLVLPAGWLALMTTSAGLPALSRAAGPTYFWSTPSPLPGGEKRILALGRNGIAADCDKAEGRIATS